MVKRHTTLNIEDDIISKAKNKGLIISEVLEEALIKKLEIKEVEIDISIKNCEFCERKKKLTWLYPDEMWICNSCLKSKGRFITK